MLNLNVGCGNKLFDDEGWVNVDAYRPLIKHDGYNFRFGTTTDLPAEDGTVDEIYMRQVFEHITPYELEASFLEMFRVLKPEGLVYMDMPNIVVAAQLLIESVACGSLELHMTALRSFYGSFETPHQLHKWGYCPELLIPLLQATGWQNVKQVPQRVHIAVCKEGAAMVEKELGLEDGRLQEIWDGRVFAVEFTKGPELFPLQPIVKTGGVKGNRIVQYPYYVK
jgi:SAM-dependent methyltransferase